MRILLDRLLFALPSPPSRATLVRGGLYLLFGAALYACFFGLLYLREGVAEDLRRAAQSAPGLRVAMSKPEVSLFPPAVDIASLSVQPQQAAEALAFRNVRARLTVFPPGIAVLADAYGGELAANVSPSSLWKPEAFDVQATLSEVLAAPLLAPFVGKKSFVQLHSGKLDGEASLSVPVRNGKPVPLAGDGSVTLRLKGGLAELGLPILKQPRLDKLVGKLETRWSKNKLDVRQVELRNPTLACTVQGTVALSPNDPPASRMDLQSALRISPDQLQQELIPQRTLQSIKDTGEVRTRLRGTFRSPSLDVQP